MDLGVHTLGEGRRDREEDLYICIPLQTRQNYYIVCKLRRGPTGSADAMSRKCELHEYIVDFKGIA